MTFFQFCALKGEKVQLCQEAIHTMFTRCAKELTSEQKVFLFSECELSFIMSCHGIIYPLTFLVRLQGKTIYTFMANEEAHFAVDARPSLLPQ